VGKVISGVCDYVSVWLELYTEHSTHNTLWQDLRIYWPEVRRSKVKVTDLWKRSRSHGGY